MIGSSRCNRRIAWLGAMPMPVTGTPDAGAPAPATSGSDERGNTGMNTGRATRERPATRAASRACAVLVALVATSACDTRQQKPKTAAIPFDVIAPAAAQTTDLVVPPAAMSGAMQPVDEAFALFAASSGLAEVEAARLVLKTVKSGEVRN